ncbi:hypothetical protein NDA14_007959 [Ustilago hordei]|nr:hypothetical protein NDA14_007959 [Ustilago hordei]
MAKFKPIFTFLLAVGVATTAYAASIPASSGSHQDTGLRTGALDDAHAILSQFPNREQLAPIAYAQAETHFQDYFSLYGRCLAPSPTCQDYICLQGTPHCKPYSAEEQRKTIEMSKKLVLNLISTVKCYPVPKGTKTMRNLGAESSNVGPLRSGYLVNQRRLQSFEARQTGSSVGRVQIDSRCCCIILAGQDDKKGVQGENEGLVDLDKDLTPAETVK